MTTHIRLQQRHVGSACRRHRASGNLSKHDRHRVRHRLLLRQATLRNLRLLLLLLLIRLEPALCLESLHLQLDLLLLQRSRGARRLLRRAKELVRRRRSGQGGWLSLRGAIW